MNKFRINGKILFYIWFLVVNTFKTNIIGRLNDFFYIFTFQSFQGVFPPGG